MLTACAASTDIVKPILPTETLDLQECTDEALPTIPGASGTEIPKRDVATVIGQQRTAALAKDKCSRDWQAFYTDLRVRLNGTSDAPGITKLWGLLK